MKHYFIPLFLLLFAVSFFGCQSAADEQPAKPQTLKVNDLIKRFKAENLPLGQLEFFNAKSDPQQLLGKPNQYTEKAIWKTTEKMVHTVEAFANETDAQARKSAIEAAAQAGTEPAGFVYAHKNILLRLHHEMLPGTAERYAWELKSL
jgi:hypothetical protein